MGERAKVAWWKPALLVLEGVLLALGIWYWWSELVPWAVVRAVEAGDVQKVERLIARGVDLNFQDWRPREWRGMVTREGWSPIHIAIARRDEEIVALLLEGGVDVETPTSRCGRTPLSMAAGDAQPDVVALLLSHGADVDAETGSGVAALYAVADSPSPRAAETARLLIDNGVDLNVRDRFGRTPLHLAASHGRNEVVELLVAKAADVNAVTRDGQSVLDAALSGGHDDIAELLREHGALSGSELRSAEERR